MIVTHSVVATSPNVPAREVSKDAWNDDHVVTGLVAADIEDSTTVGRSVLMATDAAAARTAIGAGTSSFGGAYGSLSGIPSTFAPSAHNHTGDYDPIGTAASAVATHAAAADPHTGYQRESEKGAANGYAGLDAGGKVPSAQLPAGSDPWVYLKLAVDFQTSSATAVDVTGLGFLPLLNTSYEFEGRLMMRAATATVNPRVGLAWSTGLTDGVAQIMESQAANTAPLFASGNPNAALLIAVGGLPNTTQSWPCSIRGMIVAGASPSGNTRIQLASETAATNVFIKAGSFIRYRTF